MPSHVLQLSQGPRRDSTERSIDCTPPGRLTGFATMAAGIPRRAVFIRRSSTRELHLRNLRGLNLCLSHSPAVPCRRRPLEASGAPLSPHAAIGSPVTKEALERLVVQSRILRHTPRSECWSSGRPVCQYLYDTPRLTASLVKPASGTLLLS